MWPSLWKIQYTELKLSCGNDPVVKISIYSNGDLELWPNDPKINRVLPLPQGNHVTKFGKDPIYRTKVIVRKPVWTPAIPNHIIQPVSRRAYKNTILFSGHPGISVNESSPLWLRWWNICHFTFDFHRLKMADSLLLEEVTSPQTTWLKGGGGYWVENKFCL
jgi:hypothetical protein